MTKPKLDIFLVLEELDNNNFSVHEELSQDDFYLKELETSIGWLIPRWMISSTNEKSHAELVKKFSEIHHLWYGLSKNPKLQTKLLASCGTGRPVKHKFINPKSGKRSKDTIHSLLSIMYPDINDDEVFLWCKMNTIDTVKEIAEICGCQRDETKKVIETFKKLTT